MKLQPSRRKVCSPALLFLAAWVVAGCGSGESLVHVTGTATRKGKSIPDLVITLIPEKGQRSVGLTDQDGKFTMLSTTGRQGAAVGKHRVWVQLNTAGSKDDKDFQKRLAAKQNDSEIAQILRKYGKADSTPLTIEIKESSDIMLALD